MRVSIKYSAFSLLVFSTLAFGQVEKNVGDFNKVTSFDQIDVFLIKSAENKVILNGKDAHDVELINKKGELKIRMPFLKMLDGDDVSVTVYFKSISAVEANEGSRIACGDNIKTTFFDIKAKEGSEIKLLLEVEKLTVRTANGSKVSTGGSSNDQDVLVSSGGYYEASGLKTKLTNITANAGGTALIYATELVDAKVRAGGKITISGNPKQINKDIIAGGTICTAAEAKQLYFKH